MLTIHGTPVTLERIERVRDKVERIGEKSAKNSDFYSPLWHEDCELILTALDKIKSILEEEQSLKGETQFFK